MSTKTFIGCLLAYASVTLAFDSLLWKMRVDQSDSDWRYVIDRGIARGWNPMISHAKIKPQGPTTTNYIDLLRLPDGSVFERCVFINDKESK